MIQMSGMGPQRGVEFYIGINTKKSFQLKVMNVFTRNAVCEENFEDLFNKICSTYCQYILNLIP